MSYNESDCETGCSEYSNVCVHVCSGVVGLVVSVNTCALVHLCTCVCMYVYVYLCVCARVNVSVLH